MNEQEILIIDLGTNYIKTLFIKIIDNKVFNLHGYKHVSEGISGEKIIDFMKLNQIMQEIIYLIEVEIGRKVKNVSLILSFLTNKVKIFNKSIRVNGIVTEKHIQELRGSLNLEGFSLINNISKYKIDEMEEVLNPINMNCEDLSLSGLFYYANSTIIKNISSIFSKMNIVSFATQDFLVNSYFNHSNYVIIDCGFEKTNIYVKQCERFSNFKINTGSKILLKSISEIIGTHDNPEEYVAINKENNFAINNKTQSFLMNLIDQTKRELYKKDQFFSNSIVFLTGLFTFIPFVNFFLDEQFSDNFELLNTNLIFAPNNRLITRFNLNSFFYCELMSFFLQDANQLFLGSLIYKAQTQLVLNS